MIDGKAMQRMTKKQVFFVGAFAALFSEVFFTCPFFAEGLVKHWKTGRMITVKNKEPFLMQLSFRGFVR
jgi:hypothetical protein